MTRVTPEQAQALREGTTPGPWQFKEDVTDLPNGSQELGHIVQAGTTSLFECWDDVIDKYPGNLPLAAAAPEMAQTLADMRWEYAVCFRDPNDNDDHGDAKMKILCFANSLEKAREEAYHARDLKPIIARQMVSHFEIVE